MQPKINQECLLLHAVNPVLLDTVFGYGTRGWALWADPEVGTLWCRVSGQSSGTKGKSCPCSGAVWVFGLTWHLASNCAHGCFISLWEVWWFWDCCLQSSEVSSRIYLPQTQSSSKIQKAGEERMHRKYLWERWGEENWRKKNAEAHWF